MIEVDVDIPVFLHGIDSVLEDRQVREAQEVELQQAEILDRMHLVLGHQPFRVGGLLEWHQLGQRLAADDHAGSVGRCVPRHALELLRELDDSPHALVRGDHVAQGLADLEGLVELDTELVRNGLGDAVDIAVGVAEHAPDVPDGRAGQHRAEGDDLGDVVLAVFPGDIRDHLVPAVVLEVDVDVRHRHAVRVQEPLERQAVGDRVDRRDPERVGDDGTRGTTPARRLDPLLAGEPDEVRDDQEVARIAHRKDDAELVVEACLELRGHRPVAPGEALLAFLAQPRFDGLAVRHGEVRDAQLVQRQGHVAHLGDAPRVQQGLALVREQRLHFRSRLQVEVVRFELHAVRRVEVVAGAHAQEHVLGRSLLAMDVVQVVGHDEREAGFRGQAEQLFVEPALLGQPVILELEEEPILAQDVPVLPRERPGEIPVVHFERPRDLPVEAGRQPDQALAVLRNVLPIDPGLVVVAVEVRVGDETAQVSIADQIRGQQDQVERLRVGLALLVGHRASRDVRLDADDRLDVPGLGRLVERDGAVQRAMVGDREAVEALHAGLIDEVRDPSEPVEQAELGVGVEMREVAAGQRRHRGVNGSRAGRSGLSARRSGSDEAGRDGLDPRDPKGVLRARGWPVASDDVGDVSPRSARPRREPRGMSVSAAEAAEFDRARVQPVVFDDATTKRTGGLHFGDSGSGADQAKELHPLHPADAVRFVEAFAIGKGSVLWEPVPDAQPRLGALRWRRLQQDLTQPNCAVGLPQHDAVHQLWLDAHVGEGIADTCARAVGIHAIDERKGRHRLPTWTRR